MCNFEVKLNAAVTFFQFIVIMTKVPDSGSDEPGCKNLAVERVQLMTFKVHRGFWEYVCRYVEQFTPVINKIQNQSIFQASDL